MGSVGRHGAYSSTDPGQDIGDQSLVSGARRALQLAINYSLEGVEADGHWYGELR